jgi:hypothetical protein
MMEWWNIGMLSLKEIISFLGFYFEENFPNKPLSHFPGTHWTGVGPNAVNLTETPYLFYLFGFRVGVAVVPLLSLL